MSTFEDRPEINFDNRDEFRRKGIALNLIKLLEGNKSDSIEISPVLLDGHWGSGKTEFCEKFLKQVIKENAAFRCVYIDAFKYDHCEDPLLMLITEISASIPEEKTKNDFLKKAIPVIKVLGKTIAKAAITWTLKTNVENIDEEIKGAIKEGGEDLVDIGISKVFEDFEKNEKNLKTFKAALEVIAHEVKIVIIIDELDRCRPSFALSLLEKVKHVFNIDGIQFVFTTNMKQLSAMVKKQYGHEINAESYLNKFFNYSVRLPEHIGERDERIHNGVVCFYEHVRKSSTLQGLGTIRTVSFNCIAHLIAKSNLSLRETEKLIRNLKIVDLLNDQRPFSEKNIFAWYVNASFLATFMYTFHPEIADHLLSEALTINDIDQFFDKRIEDLDPKNVTYGDNIIDYYSVFVLGIQEETGHNYLNDQLTTHWRDNSIRLFDHRLKPSGFLNLMRKTIKFLQLSNV